MKKQHNQYMAAQKATESANGMGTDFLKKATKEFGNTFQCSPMKESKIAKP